MAFKMKGFPKLSGLGGVEAEESIVRNIPTRAPGSQNPDFPEVLYTIDCESVRSLNIDEGELALKPSTDIHGKFVKHSSGKKYYYNKPKK